MVTGYWKRGMMSIAEKHTVRLPAPGLGRGGHTVTGRVFPEGGCQFFPLWAIFLRGICWIGWQRHQNMRIKKTVSEKKISINDLLFMGDSKKIL